MTEEVLLLLLLLLLSSARKQLVLRSQIAEIHVRRTAHHETPRHRSAGMSCRWEAGEGVMPIRIRRNGRSSWAHALRGFAGRLMREDVRASVAIDIGVVASGAVDLGLAQLGRFEEFVFVERYLAERRSLCEASRLCCAQRSPHHAGPVGMFEHGIGIGAVCPLRWQRTASTLLCERRFLQSSLPRLLRFAVELFQWPPQMTSTRVIRNLHSPSSVLHAIHCRPCAIYKIASSPGT